MKLNKLALGLSGGIVWGLVIFIATLWIVGIEGGKTLVLLEKFYWGYSVSIAGAFIGLAYGFVDGFIAGWLTALLYNLFSREKVAVSET